MSRLGELKDSGKNWRDVIALCALATSVPLRQPGVMPRDRYIIKNGRECLVRSERYWQGAWVTTDGYVFTGYCDMHFGEKYREHVT